MESGMIFNHTQSNMILPCHTQSILVYQGKLRVYGSMQHCLLTPKLLLPNIRHTILYICYTNYHLVKNNVQNTP
uniref:Putative ovule protein n=1 Tax=Solanum chacoense TaxID=4108 RepID=A0A0V0I8R5_SOLCH